MECLCEIFFYSTKVMKKPTFTYLEILYQFFLFFKNKIDIYISNYNSVFPSPPLSLIYFFFFTFHFKLKGRRSKAISDSKDPTVSTVQN